jgi:AcrR family transcriptional regulator
VANPVKPATPRGEQTRQNLLNAAEHEFGEKGFHSASISSITQRAGVAQGTFYIYYSSKEDILMALVQHMSRKMRHAATEATQGISDRLEVEKQGVEHFLGFARENKNLYRIVLESQFIDEKTYREYYQNLADVYAGHLKKAQDAGQIRRGDAHAQAWALMGISHFLGLRYSIWEGAEPPKDLLDGVIDFIEHGLAPE